MTTTTTTTTKPPKEPQKKAEPSARRRRILLVGLCASVVLALVAGHRGAAYLGDELGESLAKLGAPSRRRVKDIHGGPREGTVAPALAPEAASEPAQGGDSHPAEPVPSPHARVEGDSGAPAPARTRGVFVPGSVVLAYAKRGQIPAVDSAQGVVLRGVGTGNGLEDGDVVVRVGRAPVHSLREITGIVQASLFAGHTALHGTLRRGDTEIDVTVELPTGADAGP